MPSQRLTTRAEWPRIVLPIIGILVAWYIYNVQEGFYGDDPTEGGAYRLIRYGSDTNPARKEQLAIFDRYHEQERLRVHLIPGGSLDRNVPTTIAAGTAPDIIDIYPFGALRLYAEKGMIVEITDYLIALRDDHGIDISQHTWPGILDELRLPNPEWHAGDDPLRQWRWYAVPNNMNVHLVWFNQGLFERRQRVAGPTAATVPLPWPDWTWWDFIQVARVMQHRSDTGQLLTFGSQPPKFLLLYMQICQALAGQNGERLDGLTPAELATLGFDAASAAQPLNPFLPQQDGGHRLFPNHLALEQALQLNHDMRHIFDAAPTSSEAQQTAQIASEGGDVTQSGYGQFKAGILGMLQEGRWFLGQVRNDVRFDWRLLRMPRWVPYEAWADWQARGLSPEQRDGPYGVVDQQRPLAGSLNFIGSRKSAITRTALEQGRADDAWLFLQFLLTNEDFNRILLVEDGMGANRAQALDYLASSDPLFPGEDLRRPPQQETAALQNLVPKPTWPYHNFGLDGYGKIDRNLKQWTNQSLTGTGPAGATMTWDYSALGVSTPADLSVGQRLSERLLAASNDMLQAGTTPPPQAAPSGRTLIVFGILAALFSLLGYSLLRQRRPVPTPNRKAKTA